MNGYHDGASPGRVLHGLLANVDALPDPRNPPPIRMMPNGRHPASPRLSRLKTSRHTGIRADSSSSRYCRRAGVPARNRPPHHYAPPHCTPPNSQFSTASCDGDGSGFTASIDQSAHTMTHYSRASASSSSTSPLSPHQHPPPATTGRLRSEYSTLAAPRNRARCDQQPHCAMPDGHRQAFRVSGALHHHIPGVIFSWKIFRIEIDDRRWQAGWNEDVDAAAIRKPASTSGLVSSNLAPPDLGPRMPVAACS